MFHNLLRAVGLRPSTEPTDQQGWKESQLRLSIEFSNASDRPLEVVIEPWGMVHRLPSRASCAVVSVGGDPPAVINVEMIEDGYTFWFETPGAIYEYWQDGELLD